MTTPPLMEWTFVDAVLEQIDREVVAHPPERGGVLLGPLGLSLVSHFALDTEASTTGTMYLPSAHISEVVASMEAPGTIELKGILHSHPGLDRLSAQDERSFAHVLDVNPRLSPCLAPIATQRRARDDHELDVAHGKLSLYQVVRTRRGPLVQPARPVTLPAMAVARQVAAADGLGPCEARLLGPATGMGTPTVDVLLADTEVGDVILAFPPGFPTVAPIVALAPATGAAAFVPVVWRPGAAPTNQIVSAVLRAAGRPPRRRIRRTRRAPRATV